MFGISKTGLAVWSALFWTAWSMTFQESGERWDDTDLFRFVSRPDLTPPKFDIILHNKEKTTPGYLFVAPYSKLVDGYPSDSYVSQQQGPHIYDLDGELVWSGAEYFRDKPGFDFKVATINGSNHLTLMTRNGLTDAPENARSAGYVLDSSYQLVAQLTTQIANGSMDIHEFTVLDGGRSALFFTEGEASVYHHELGRDIKVRETTIEEVDLVTSESLFQWSCLEHIALAESSHDLSHSSSPRPWDYLHPNAVDKTSDGNYLLSARHTNTVYFISGKDGSIIWRLGGKNSSFELDGFNFSRQHDARVRSQNDSVVVISLLDNARDGISSVLPSANISSMLVIALHITESPMRASLLSRYERPDGEYSRERGNAQILDDTNILGGWGDNAYNTEHTKDGELVYEAVWISSRFVNYRTYKFNFTAFPREEISVKAYVSTTSRGESTTVIHTSWNGATEVRAWRFYAFDHAKGESVMVGSTRKTGFETAFVCHGFYPNVLVEGLDGEGRSLGNSSFQPTETPLGWDGGDVVGFPVGKHNPISSLDRNPRLLAALSFLTGVASVLVYRALSWRQYVRASTGFIPTYGSRKRM